MRKQKVNKKRVIGITGIFGSGKSTVSGIFRSKGATVIDADRIAHRHLLPGTTAYEKIVSLFGNNILNGRKINRAKLARLVFGNKGFLLKLNKIVHPFLISEIRSKINKAKQGIVVLDAPLLVEVGLRRLVDDLIVVVVERENLIRRLLKKTNLKKADILRRLRSQIPLHLKKRVADFIIDNNSTILETNKQVKRVIAKIQGGSCGKARD